MQLMSIDTGTQGTRVSLIDENGNEVASVSRNQKLESPQPGWGVQKPSIWWDNAHACIKEIASNYSSEVKKIAGIGVCGQMHGSVAIDKNGDLIDFPVPLWCDKRESKGLKNLKQDEIEFLYNHTGNLPLSAWVGFKIQWIKENMKDVYKNADKFITPKDYLNYMLTGEIATDPTEASGYYVYDANKEEWSRELTQVLKIDFEKLPQIVPSYEKIGVIKNELARSLGLPKGIPVAAGSGDFLCHHLASGTTLPGRAMDHIGTAAALSVVVKKPLFNKKLMNLRHVTDSWISFGILDSGGGSLRWLRDNTCIDLMEVASKKKKDPYEIMIKMTMDVPPGSDGVFFLPYLQGERTTGTSYSRGVFFGISSFHQRKHLIHAVLEGVIFDMKQIMDIIENAGVNIPEVRLTGGGARSDYWSQMRADIYDANILVMKSVEGGIMGASILAGCAAGIFKDPANAADKISAKIKKVFKPDKKKVEIYTEIFLNFLEIHDSFQEYFIKLNNWRKSWEKKLMV